MIVRTFLLFSSTVQTICQKPFRRFLMSLRSVLPLFQFLHVVLHTHGLVHGTVNGRWIFRLFAILQCTCSTIRIVYIHVCFTA
ncbi:hypothetical protein IW262DRAFT_361551 [Armillaria fumosa]|nr:hypothetical protein IW262DRAFT_361551 [Armillaria fumosa]